MAIITIKASKATPGKAVAYVTDRGKASLVSAANLDPSQDLAQQMMMTAKLWGKAQGEDDRKYYHLKLAFAPEDWVENGGTLTEAEALKIGMVIMREISPTSEEIGSVHIDKRHLHFHGLINAVDLETGKMLDLRRADYRRVKDRVQEICAERGLNAIDWRQATKEKRAREQQPEAPTVETFAEKGLKARGKGTWKDELRAAIDAAASSSTSLEEFRAELAAQGVTLSRCTDTTISYRMGDHKAVRGDTLGGDYTAQAIRDALEHNAQEPAPELGKEKISLAAQIGGADRKKAAQDAGGRVIDAQEREMWRDLGRCAGVKRAQVDAWCDEAEKPDWEIRRDAWDSYKASKALFWDAYNAEAAKLRAQMDKKYKDLKRVRRAEWATDPRNRQKTLLGVVYGLIVLSRKGDVYDVKRDIEALKAAQADLRRARDAFKGATSGTLELLRDKGLSADAYAGSVRRLQERCEDMQRRHWPTLAVEDLDQQRRAQIEKQRAEKRARKDGPSR